MTKTAPPIEDKANNHYREMLLEKKRSVLASLGVKCDTLARLGRVAEEDQAPISHDEFVSSRLNSLEYGHLRLVNEALDRLDCGEYGICLSCDKPIPAKRLRALPWARYCVSCQEALARFSVEEQDEDAPNPVMAW